jgi:hypothetical protein
MIEITGPQGVEGGKKEFSGNHEPVRQDRLAKLERSIIFSPCLAAL